MTRTGELHEPSRWNLACHPACAVNRYVVFGPVNKQSRCTNRRQHVPDVDVHVHAVERRNRPRAGAPPEIIGKERGLVLVTPEPLRDSLHRLLTRPEELRQARLRFIPVLLLGRGPRIIVRP